MLTLFVFILPLVLGLLFILFKDTFTVSSWVVKVVAIALVVLSLVVYRSYAQNLPVLDYNIPWLKAFSINFHLALDGLSVIFVMLALTISALILLAVDSLNYKNKALLIGFICLTTAALVGLFMSKDIFFFYFFFELALLPVYLIANIWGGESASKITFKMLVYTVFGSLLMFVGFVFLYMRAQTADISSLQSTVGLLPVSLKTLLFIGFTLAFAIKTPVFPFHSWLPDAYSESPTPATMLLSGLLSKMGIYGLLRILAPLAPEGLSTYGHILIVLAIIGLLYGAIIAVKQGEFKRVLAYSSFSHMGLMAASVLTLSESGLKGAVLQTVAHAFSAVGLFYVAKIVFEKTGSRKLSELGGLVHTAPKLAVVFMIILLSSVALPLTNAFVGEFLMLKSVFDFNSTLGILAGLSIVFGAVYMLRAYQNVMFGPETKSSSKISDIGAKELWVFIPIVLVILVFGLYPQPILDLSSSVLENIISK